MFAVKIFINKNDLSEPGRRKNCNMHGKIINRRFKLQLAPLVGLSKPQQTNEQRTNVDETINLSITTSLVNSVVINSLNMLLEVFDTNVVLRMKSRSENKQNFSICTINISDISPQVAV